MKKDKPYTSIIIYFHSKDRNHIAQDNESLVVKMQHCHVAAISGRLGGDGGNVG